MNKKVLFLCCEALLLNKLTMKNKFCFYCLISRINILICLMSHNLNYKRNIMGF